MTTPQLEQGIRKFRLVIDMTYSVYVDGTIGFLFIANSIEPNEEVLPDDAVPMRRVLGPMRMKLLAEDRGVAASGNPGDSVNVALAFVHWWKLDK